MEPYLSMFRSYEELIKFFERVEYDPYSLVLFPQSGLIFLFYLSDTGLEDMACETRWLHEGL